jgi:mRNA-degrading endonuclease RelE of RelBE toxin-antitoxin system
MRWAVIVDDGAAKRMRRFPRQDQERIAATLVEMEADPFTGDIVRLKGPNGFRRRVGAYRILFDVNVPSRRVEVTDITRRTTTTY